MEKDKLIGIGGTALVGSLLLNAKLYDDLQKEKKVRSQLGNELSRLEMISQLYITKKYPEYYPEKRRRKSMFKNLFTKKEAGPKVKWMGNDTKVSLGITGALAIATGTSLAVDNLCDGGCADCCDCDLEEVGEAVEELAE